MQCEHKALPRYMRNDTGANAVSGKMTDNEISRRT